MESRGTSFFKKVYATNEAFKDARTRSSMRSKLIENNFIYVIPDGSNIRLDTMRVAYVNVTQYMKSLLPKAKAF